MSFDLSAQTVLVTGAGRGLGRGCAEAMAEAGARVIGVARSQPELASLAAHSSGNIETWCLDVTGDEILERIDRRPDITVLLNNAGSNKPEPITAVEDETLDRLLDINVRAPFRIARAVVQNMLSAKIEGSIIHMSSQMGHVGSPNRTVYCTTKHAIEGLTRSMAVELGPSGIRVNSIAPTFVETPLTKPMLDDPAFHSFVMERMILPDLPTIEEIAGAACYLASDLARHVTGHSLRVDGGWTAH